MRPGSTVRWSTSRTRCRAGVTTWWPWTWWGYQIRVATDHNPQLAVFGDSAYSRHTDWTPSKKLKDVERTPQDIAFNRAIASFRAPVERAIGLLKQWKILATGYRGHLTELPTVIHAIVNLEFY